MILDSDLDELIKPGQVVLVKVDEVGSQLSRLKDDLKNFPNAKLILENGRNIRLIIRTLQEGKTPVLMMGKSTLDSSRQEIKNSITHVFKTSDYINQEAADMFLF